MLIDDDIDNILFRPLNPALSADSALSASTCCSWKPFGPVAAPGVRQPPRERGTPDAITGPAARAISSAVLTRAGECRGSPAARERLSGAGRAAVARSTRSRNESSGGRFEKLASSHANNATQMESENAMAVSRDYDNFEMVTRHVLLRSVLCITRCITFALSLPSNQ